MIRWLKQPKSSNVADFVTCYWLIEKETSHNGVPFPKLNPDPSAHLIISPNEQPYAYKRTDVTFTGFGSHLLYPNQSTLELDHRHPFISLGIKFNVGALYSIPKLGQPHSSIDKAITIDVASLLSCNQDKIAQLLPLAKSDPAACCHGLDELLSPWLQDVKHDKHSLLTVKALENLDTTPISELGQLLHCTQRTLERSFNKVTGLTLKQYQSMTRLEAMLEHLYSLDKKDIVWSDIAIKFGFSDQSHLIRYLKMHLGITPGNYANERGFTIDAYGGISDLS